MRQNIRRETWTPTKPRFVAVCSVHLSYANLNAVWGIRTPMSFRATVFKTAAIPFCTKTATIKFIKKNIKETGLVRFELTWYSSQSAGPYRLATAQYFFRQCPFSPCVLTDLQVETLSHALAYIAKQTRSESNTHLRFWRPTCYH